MLTAFVIDYKGDWDDHLPLIVFVYNNRYYYDIQMTPYEALNRRRCRSHVDWFEIGDTTLIGTNSALYVVKRVQIIEIDL